MSQATIPSIDELLSNSNATEDFKDAVRNLEASSLGNDKIKFGPGNPPVKVLRVVCGLLEAFPETEFHDVEINGQSGCSDYRGTVKANGGKDQFRFVWDCRWRAEQEGLKDFFGEPDQQKAARTFGFRCFEKFEKV